MKKKSLKTMKQIISAFVLFVFIFAAVSYFYNFWLFVAEMAAALVLCIFAIISLYVLKGEIHSYFNNVAKSIDHGTGSLINFKLPVMVVNKNDEIIWYNYSFRSSVLKDDDIYACNVSIVFNRDVLYRLEQFSNAKFTFNDKKFIVYEYKFGENLDNQKMYFFVDETSSYLIAKKYKETRPCVMLIEVDDLDFCMKSSSESEKSEMLSTIQKQIERFNQHAGGYFQKISTKRYVLIVEKTGFDKIVENKFSVLNDVRVLDLGQKGSASLSIGVGVEGTTLEETVQFANQALDMALGRGGDQAVIKDKEKFEFFGGVTQTRQINSRVRARVVATTLLKMIDNSENVLIMGHSFSDMDSFGSAYALWYAITKLNYNAKIVINRETTLAKPLINFVMEDEIAKDCIVSPEMATQLINKKTLLIIVDTHRSSFLENKKVYEKAPDVIVIDHHRKTVDFIDDSLLFYHDPSASSTSEMVSELLQYMGNNLIGTKQAEALLAGIMLDTRNFVLRTGTRTFEASAYLRHLGANPVEVKKLFSDTMDVYTIRSAIVSQAEVFEHCAVSSCEEDDENNRIACSQAADELLSIKGVNASFVLFQVGDTINISARSLGIINVQVIMELLGGGGHQTMAAAQLKNETFESAKNKLFEAIKNAKEKA